MSFKPDRCLEGIFKLGLTETSRPRAPLGIPPKHTPDHITHTEFTFVRIGPALIEHFQICSRGKGGISPNPSRGVAGSNAGLCVSVKVSTRNHHFTLK